jgi:hypothetical protein
MPSLGTLHLCRPQAVCQVGGGGRLVLAALLLAVVAPQALASSPEAWRAYGQEVRSACKAASRLRQPRVLGERIDLPATTTSPDGVTLMISALLLEGRYPQAHMRGQMGRELCLFDQRTRRASVGEADLLDRPRPKP